MGSGLGAVNYMANFFMRFTNMKIDYFFLIIFTLFSISQSSFSQDYTDNTNGTAKIVFAEIKYEGNITAYKLGNTRVYPPQKIPIEKRSYKGSFKVS